jgi:hypothetical protein
MKESEIKIELLTVSPYRDRRTQLTINTSGLPESYMRYPFHYVDNVIYYPKKRKQLQA